MKRRHVLSLVVALSLLKGQQSDATKTPEPDVLGVVFYLDPSDHTIKALPKEQWKAIGKAKAGWSTVSSTGSIQLSGVSSSFRVPASDKNEFVFRITTDPERVKLYPCSQDKKKGFRLLEVVETKTQGHLFGRATSTRESVSGVPVEIVKYGESSFKLVSERLAPGEYAILTGGGAVFSFSVQ